MKLAQNEGPLDRNLMKNEVGKTVRAQGMSCKE